MIFRKKSVALTWSGMAWLILLAGCGREPPTVRRTAEVPPTDTVGLTATRTPLGAALEGKPWIAHVLTSDLDQDGRDDLLVCESRENRISWIRPTATGGFEEITLAESVPAPVHTTVVDLDGDGDLDIVVACMGEVFPNNDRIGSVVVLENDGTQTFTPRVIADHIARVTDVRAADLNGDGRMDLAVAQFGYDQGEVTWMENRGDGRFDRHLLLSLSGAINVEIADMDGDRTPDIVAVVAQQWEEVYLFSNRGHGDFSRKVIFASTNEDFGSSGIRLVDMNRDGRPDVLYSNGDGFDYAEPGSRAWHGVQWLENRGDGFFRFHRIGDLPGAYSPVAIDLNGDGALDVVACSGFNEWSRPEAVALMAFINDGAFNFTPQVLAREPTHLMTLTTAHLDGADAPPVIISGGFHAYPPWDRMSRVMAWRTTVAPEHSEGSSPGR
ncbi:FG-GAP repeat domain-containing protein [Synoicihabitans lomoniglobus]|uniref:VCBS repeat-containing protein n=1 Tax=Synoicihabitans lomoniglobus TaxID=2909285 RepID=A0AAF0CPB2_9BACT|nr:VCBS repeat-containing protein [Opitutaceae bacterium LMO-M01]WED63829.1 VCBS repeat-containing protein [Opitutaceae bacterium LMO-M01]